jgi:hypothetical protein
MDTKKFLSAFATLAGIAVLSGCGPDPVVSMTSAPKGTAPAQAPFVPKAEAGIRREPSDPAALIAEANKMPVVVRDDPFALRGDEIRFDREQLAASFVDDGGWYANIAEERVERQETFQVEPQPTRRLAGILIGETITALIDMGDNSGLQTIRPGQEIRSGNTTWVVQSIDEEKAILRRKEGNIRPKYVVVRLEDSASAANPAPTGGGSANPRGGGGGGGAGGRANDRD